MKSSDSYTYEQAIANPEAFAQIYQQTLGSAEQNTDLKTYLSWYDQYYTIIIDRLDALEKQGNIFLKSALSLGQKEKIIEKLNNLDLLFHVYKNQLGIFL